MVNVYGYKLTTKWQNLTEILFVWVKILQKSFFWGATFLTHTVDVQQIKWLLCVCCNVLHSEVCLTCVKVELTEERASSERYKKQSQILRLELDQLLQQLALYVIVIVKRMYFLIVLTTDYCWHSWTSRIAAPYKSRVDWLIDWLSCWTLLNFAVNVVNRTLPSA